MEGSKKRKKTNFVFNDFSRLVVCKIAEFCGIDDVLNLGLTNKKNQETLKSELLWQHLVKRDFGEIIRLSIDNDWYNVYIDEFRAKKQLKRVGVSYDNVFEAKLFYLYCCLIRCGLRRQLDPSAGDNWAVQMAARNGREDIVKLLLEDERVDPSANNNCAVRHAAYHGRHCIVRLLLQDDRVDPGANNNYAVRYAAANGHEGIVRLLLEDERVDSSADDNYAVQYAARNGHEGIVRLLLKNERVEPSANNNLAVRYAAEYGHEGIVRLLLEDERVDPSARGNWALQRAARCKHERIVKLLLEDKRVGYKAALAIARANGYNK